MKITKSHLRKIIKEEMKDLHELKPGTLSGPGPNPGDPPFKRGPRFPDYIKPIEYQNLTKEKGGRLSDIARKALENADERAGKKGELRRSQRGKRPEEGKWNMYEGSEEEADLKALKDEVYSTADEIFYAAEDWIDDNLPGGGRTRLKDLGIDHMQLKVSLKKFLVDSIANMAGVDATPDTKKDSHSKPWLQIKPFEEGKKK